MVANLDDLVDNQSVHFQMQPVHRQTVLSLLAEAAKAQQKLKPSFHLRK